ncbi:MAG: hypothetical protein EPO29_05345 [Betaproteobacteria bacterium]|nr:MAG: hypothetical protein EPO29_05345 [Betaproteobacteria bacterium]
MVERRSGASVRRRMRCAAAILVAALAAAGCATRERLPDHALSPEARDCAAWYRSLDEQVASAGVRDAQDAPVAGFPYLRVNRFLASYRPFASAGDETLRAWTDRLLALDAAARRHEIANLPAERVDRLPDREARLSRGSALKHTAACGRLLRDADLARPESREALLERAQVPDDYSTARRVVGLYALTRHAFAEGVRRYEDEALAAYRQAPAAGFVLRYSPPHASASPSHEAMAATLRQSARNPLAIPEPGEAELETLFALHAPVLDVAITGDHDRFGALRWKRDAAVPGVDASDLVVYRNAAWTQYEGRALLQLAYTVWFAERPPESDGDLYAGALDGLTWRVTLAPDGEPLVYDSIHPCGCFHLFFPTPRARALPAPDPLEEWMFSPQSLPRLAPGERPVLRIASRTHALIGVTLERNAERVARYALRPYDELRSLQRLDGGRQSVFGPDGLIAGTERAERFLFWPMGIASAGAMRQWGRHATAFVGRRHFDDADLFERRFVFDLW